MFKLSFYKMGTVQKFQRIEPDTIEQFCVLDYLFIKLMVIWFVYKCHVCIYLRYFCIRPFTLSDTIMVYNPQV